LLAASPDGVPEPILLAHGIFGRFDSRDLIRAGLVTVTPEYIVMGPRTIEVTLVRITGAGAEGTSKMG
jgi:hypothetical protein